MRQVKIALAVFFFIFISTLCHAQTGIINYTSLLKPVEEYGKVEWTINVSSNFVNPYDQADIRLDMLLSSPSGKQLALPCYFESGNSKASVWKARYAPQEIGEYRLYFILISKTGESKGDVSFFTAEASGKKGFLHKNNLWTFKYDNGELFRGIGENIGWESRSFENDKFTYDYLLPKLSSNGANFFRTWMCYWNIPLQWKNVSSTKRYSNSDEYFNPGGIKRMDELVKLTDSLHLHFMLTLDWHGSLMEEGGWKNSDYNAVNGGPAKTPTEFFTSQKARAMYKNKLRYIVARWGYSTSIAAFEFFNEIDNAAFNGADSVLIPHHYITEWHDEMGRYLKDIDAYGHLVTTSISHRDIMGLNSVAYIDFNQKHIYKNTGKIPFIYQDYINQFGKPYVIGEFGYRWEDADPKYADLADFDFKRGLWYGLFSPCPIIPMSWWWEFFDDEHMEPYFKGVRTISDEMLKAGQGSFEQFGVSSGVVESYGVKCGNKYFIYLLNNAFGTSPVPLKISFGVSGKNFTVTYFNPADQTTSSGGKVTATGNRLALSNKIIPQLKQDRIIIITAN